jgi:hypothetical protein
MYKVKIVHAPRKMPVAVFASPAGRPGRDELASPLLRARPAALGCRHLRRAVQQLL